MSILANKAPSAAWAKRNGLPHLSEALGSAWNPLSSVRSAMDSWLASVDLFESEDASFDAQLGWALTVGDFQWAEQLIDESPAPTRTRAIANLKSARGELAAADKLFRSAINNGDTDAYVDFANSLMHRAEVDFPAVRTLLMRAIALGDILGWASLSTAYWLEGDDEAAMQSAMDGVDAGSIGSLVRLAYAAYGLGYVRIAMAASLDALQLGAEEALFPLACCISLLGDYVTLGLLVNLIRGRINPVLESEILSEFLKGDADEPV
ncbi:hypothetical protein IEE94_09090 [Yimella sp. cx-573]|nr:hypothetical protein [Yimella sp. cx-573]